MPSSRSLTPPKLTSAKRRRLRRDTVNKFYGGKQVILRETFLRLRPPYDGLRCVPYDELSSARTPSDMVAQYAGLVNGELRYDVPRPVVQRTRKRWSDVEAKRRRVTGETITSRKLVLDVLVPVNGATDKREVEVQTEGLFSGAGEGQDGCVSAFEDSWFFEEGWTRLDGVDSMLENPTTGPTDDLYTAQDHIAHLEEELRSCREFAADMTIDHYEAMGNFKIPPRTRRHGTWPGVLTGLVVPRASFNDLVAYYDDNEEADKLRAAQIEHGPAQVERLLHGEPLVEEELEEVMADEGEVKEDHEVSSDEMAEGSESEQTQEEDEAMCVACDMQLP